MSKKINLFFTRNWRVKLICLLLALLVWSGVRYSLNERIQDAPSEEGDIIMSEIGIGINE